MKSKTDWSKDKVYRTTRCFSPRTNGYPGGFPIGFIDWVRQLGYWGKDRVYLCCGKVEDKEAIRVDIEPSTNPTHLEDARATSLPDNAFDWVMIDPPYTADLAETLYDKRRFWSSINIFTKEAERITRAGGLICTLSYEIPKRVPNCDLVACVGVYQTMGVRHMMCFSVWKKRKEKPDHDGKKD